MTAVVHGGLDHAELDALGIEPEQVLDFSSNINPFGPPASVRQALAALDPAPYPDRTASSLRAALAGRHGCMPASLVIGNGSVELIHLVARALLRRGDWVVVVEPTFGEYAHASRLAGAVVLSVRSAHEAGFAVCVEAALAQVALHRPRLVWLCSPNNPTGVVVHRREIARLARACADVDGYLVLDAAYGGMERDGSSLAGLQAPNERILIIHSLTKVYALAGLRLGYMAASPDILERIAVYQPAWSVNSAAQVAGQAALEDRSFLAATTPRWWACSDALRDGLGDLGLAVCPSSLPFFLVRVGDGAAVRGALLRGGCLVRDCASFGLPAYVRVAPRSPAENQRLIDAWRSICPRPS